MGTTASAKLWGSLEEEWPFQVLWRVRKKCMTSVFRGSGWRWDLYRGSLREVWWFLERKWCRINLGIVLLTLLSSISSLIVRCAIFLTSHFAIFSLFFLPGCFRLQARPVTPANFLWWGRGFPSLVSSGLSVWVSALGYKDGIDPTPPWSERHQPTSRHG